MKCLLLNVGPIVLKNHTGPTYFAYALLTMHFFADHTNLTGPESQYLALRMQLEQLSNIYDSKDEWEKVEKSNDGYLGRLKMDNGGGGKNPRANNSYRAGNET